jgi:hypothetical protein
MAPRSSEASEIWTQEAVSLDALSRARAALQPAAGVTSISAPALQPASDDAKLHAGSKGTSIAPAAESVQTPSEPETPSASDRRAPLETVTPVAPETPSTDSDNPY